MRSKAPEALWSQAVIHLRLKACVQYEDKLRMKPGIDAGKGGFCRGGKSQVSPDTLRKKERCGYVCYDIATPPVLSPNMKFLRFPFAPATRRRGVLDRIYKEVESPPSSLDLFSNFPLASHRLYSIP